MGTHTIISISLSPLHLLLLSESLLGLILRKQLKSDTAQREERAVIGAVVISYYTTTTQQSNNIICDTEYENVPAAAASRHGRAVRAARAPRPQPRPPDRPLLRARGGGGPRGGRGRQGRGKEHRPDQRQHNQVNHCLEVDICYLSTTHSFRHSIDLFVDGTPLQKVCVQHPDIPADTDTHHGGVNIYIWHLLLRLHANRGTHPTI